MQCLTADRAPLRAFALIGLVLVGLGTCALVASLNSAALAPRPSEPLLLEVTGRAFEWHLCYAGADGVLGTADDRRATGGPHLPAETSVILRLTSADSLYSFAVPALGLNDVAVPQRTYELRFQTRGVAELALRGDQFCGFSHPRLITTVQVESNADFATWLARLEPANPSSVP